MDTIININTKETIQAEIRAQIEGVSNWIKKQADKHFEYTPAEKWSTGQHLDHLIKSIQPLNIALGLPKTMLKERFGALSRPAKTYRETLEWYASELAKGSLQAMGKFVPEEVKLAQKASLLQELINEGQKMMSIVEQWSEKELDSYCIPHPLLGNMTVREMLFFTIFHTLHHCNSLKVNYPTV